MFISIGRKVKYFYLLLPTIHQSQCMSLFASHPVNLKISEKKILTEVFLDFFLINFIHLLRLPPLRFHCGVGCWD